MGDYTKLKAAIAGAIKANGNNEISGAIMQVVLNTIVSTVGANSTFVGIANKNTNPGTPDGNVFYIAYEAGKYVNFGGIQIDDSVFILQNKNDSWKSVDIGIVIRDFTNTKVFTKNFNANKVIRKLFIDTSEYSGGLSLDGLKIKIIAKNVGGSYGIQLRNSANEMIVSPWMKAGNSIQSVTVDGIYIYVEYNWENMNDGQLGGSPFMLTNEAFNSANDPRGSITNEKIANDSIDVNKIQDNAVTQEKIESNVNLSTTTLTNGLYGQAGDSISEGAGLRTLLPDSDPYAPISGTKKATYGYYIAKLNRMRWANYGKSGSTLGFVVANGSNKNGFSKENGRYTQMDNNLTHLSIFFGWDDSYYGPIMKREDWLFDTYSTKIYYPRTPDLIGTNASDGTPYTTQEQYKAVNAVTGNVGGIDYDNSNSYFNALYVGTKDDNTNKTFWGAWNIVLPYLIEKYPFAKILLIVPFGTTDLMRQCVRDAAQKYGLTYYDFSSINNQLFYQWDDNKPNGMVAGKTISQFRIDNLTYDGLHPDEEGYKYLYPSINAKLMSM